MAGLALASENALEHVTHEVLRGLYDLSPVFPKNRYHCASNLAPNERERIFGLDHSNESFWDVLELGEVKETKPEVPVLCALKAGVEAERVD